MVIEWNWTLIVDLQLAPWLAVEIPDLIEKGIIVYQDKDGAK